MSAGTACRASRQLQSAASAKPFTICYLICVAAVQVLDVSRNRLQGELPAALGGLSHTIHHMLL